MHTRTHAHSHDHTQPPGVTELPKLLEASTPCNFIRGPSTLGLHNRLALEPMQCNVQMCWVHDVHTQVVRLCAKSREDVLSPCEHLTLHYQVRVCVRVCAWELNKRARTHTYLYLTCKNMRTYAHMRLHRCVQAWAQILHSCALSGTRKQNRHSPKIGKKLSPKERKKIYTTQYS